MNRYLKVIIIVLGVILIAESVLALLESNEERDELENYDEEDEDYF